MPTVKQQMAREVDEAAKRADIMVGSVRSWPMSAMSAFLDACGRLTGQLKPVCEWTEIEAGSGIYNTCKEGEEWHVPEGLELYPFCHWCGYGIKVVEFSDPTGDKHG
jgi:hypothetical protein